METGKGYWIQLNKGKSYYLTGQSIPHYTHSVNEDGWIMIGGCTSAAKAFSNNCSIVVIYVYVQGTGYQRVLESESLDPCKGYWILLKDVAGYGEHKVEVYPPS